MSLVVRRARLVSGRPGEPARDGVDVRVEGDRITAVGPDLPGGDEEIDAAGRVVVPGFVDAHTHLCWAGDRLDEWEALLAGRPYLEILAAGGGILSTVRAVRAASREQLAAALRARLDVALRGGTTTIEVKSGYGLTVADELKQLDAIVEAATGFPGTVVRTALLGHALDPDRPGLVDEMVDEALPALQARHAGIAVDAYVEEGAWSVADAVRLFRAARRLCHPLRVHADQFHAVGMLEAAVTLGARSVDHLEATAPDGLARLARAGIFGVMLPVSGLHTDGRYADGRAFLDAGGRLVVATNANPGTSPTTSMPLVIAVAVRKLGITPAEAIVAATSAPAALLGLHDRGVVAPGMRADLLVLRHTDERALAWELGGDPVDVVVCGGRVVRGG